VAEDQARERQRQARAELVVQSLATADEDDVSARRSLVIGLGEFPPGGPHGLAAPPRQRGDELLGPLPAPGEGGEVLPRETLARTRKLTAAVRR
jgi:hypothetical protein